MRQSRYYSKHDAVESSRRHGSLQADHLRSSKQVSCGRGYKRFTSKFLKVFQPTVLCWFGEVVQRSLAGTFDLLVP